MNLDSSGNDKGLPSIQALSCLKNSSDFWWHCDRRNPKLVFAAAFIADNQYYIFPICYTLLYFLNIW